MEGAELLDISLRNEREVQNETSALQLWHVDSERKQHLHPRHDGVRGQSVASRRWRSKELREERDLLNGKA